MSLVLTGNAAPPVDQRLLDLRRMRVIATLLLVLMTIVFIIAALLQPRWPGLEYVRAFAEAGMVGACADWFAVVALFRHPLGIPIPHTGIVPRNKARIANALGRFITNNFLTPKVLSGKLRDIDAARAIADWMIDPDNAKRIARNAAMVVPEVVRALPREKIAQITLHDVMAKSVTVTNSSASTAVAPLILSGASSPSGPGRNAEADRTRSRLCPSHARGQQGFHPSKSDSGIVALDSALG